MITTRHHRSSSSLKNLALGFFIGLSLLGAYFAFDYQINKAPLLKIKINAEFIPRELCGSIYSNYGQPTEGELEELRRSQIARGVSISSDDYFLGVTISNESERTIRNLTVSVDTYAPYDKQSNPFEFVQITSTSFELFNPKLQELSLRMGEYKRLCQKIFLNKDYSKLGLYELRHITNVLSVNWGN